MPSSRSTIPPRSRRLPPLKPSPPRKMLAFPKCPLSTSWRPMPSFRKPTPSRSSARLWLIISSRSSAVLPSLGKLKNGFYEKFIIFWFVAMICEDVWNHMNLILLFTNLMTDSDSDLFIKRNLKITIRFVCIGCWDEVNMDVVCWPSSICLSKSISSNHLFSRLKKQ